MTETEVTIANGAGLILSLVCSYVPGAKQKYAALDGTGKRLVMLGLLFLAALGIFGASCAGYISTVACDQAGAMKLVGLFFAAAVANQATFLFTPKSAK